MKMFWRHLTTNVALTFSNGTQMQSPNFIVCRLKHELLLRSEQMLLTCDPSSVALPHLVHTHLLLSTLIQPYSFNLNPRPTQYKVWSLVAGIPVLALTITI